MKRLAVGGGVVAVALLGAFFLVRRRFAELSGGLPSFDARPGGYSLGEAQSLLSALGSDGIAYYAHVQLPLDLIFPLAYALALGFGTILLMRGAARSENRVAVTLRSVIYAAPFLAAIFDYWENWLVWRMLDAGARDVTKVLVDEASRTTTYKWVFLTIALAGFFLAGLRVLLSSRRGAKRRS
ncbi:hypothetical protein D1F64_09965 [Breoghania sp. L-A4]|nr:hypothetical protein D1F64_09965 [Breoghania sp. L-A4]